ncbi:hypothetical protein E6O75_ATG10809 [Venturia nashicola]|uniref:Uncharacterized protein n=1 Tax=Venturia nashicola TaxID=86259 RepID=A0A4Z1PAF8_9PEZI|nr:hypothetical protein E6O75_ATG10809 [Venturia nashicola]
MFSTLATLNDKDRPGKGKLTVAVTVSINARNPAISIRRIAKSLVQFLDRRNAMQWIFVVACKAYELWLVDQSGCVNNKPTTVSNLTSGTGTASYHDANDHSP